MTDSAAFVGSIPERYDRCLGPMLFEPYADEMVRSLEFHPGIDILELAAGTGIVSKRLAAHLPADGSLTVTDLNEPMLEIARSKVNSPNVRFEAADACELQFEDGQFDTLVCQYGVMFFPDKPKAMREAFRVLRPGGMYRFNVWDAIEHNEVTLAAHGVLQSMFGEQAPSFYSVPFGFYDLDVIHDLLQSAGFQVASAQTMLLPCVSETVERAVEGLYGGSPIAIELQELDDESAANTRAALHERLKSKFGDNPMRATMQAHVVEARKP